MLEEIKEYIKSLTLETILNQPFVKAGAIGSGIVSATLLLSVVPIIKYFVLPLTCFGYIAIPLACGYYASKISSSTKGDINHGGLQGGLTGLFIGIVGGLLTLILSIILNFFEIDTRVGFAAIQAFNFNDYSLAGISSFSEVLNYLVCGGIGVTITCFINVIFGVVGGIAQVTYGEDFKVGEVKPPEPSEETEKPLQPTS